MTPVFGRDQKIKFIKFTKREIAVLNEAESIVRLLAHIGPAKATVTESSIAAGPALRAVSELAVGGRIDFGTIQLQLPGLEAEFDVGGKG